MIGRVRGLALSVLLAGALAACAQEPPPPPPPPDPAVIADVDHVCRADAAVLAFPSAPPPGAGTEAGVSYLEATLDRVREAQDALAGVRPVPGTVRTVADARGRTLGELRRTLEIARVRVRVFDDPGSTLTVTEAQLSTFTLLTPGVPDLRTDPSTAAAYAQAPACRS